MKGQIFSLIRTKYNTLSSSQKDVADYILTNPDKVMMNTLNEIAAACRVSETTVLRFLHKLNYNSCLLYTSFDFYTKFVAWIGEALRAEEMVVVEGNQ